VVQEQKGKRDSRRLVGEQLLNARLSSGLTARQVSETTRITLEMLHSLEAGQFEDCGGDVYARGHIRAYARALGLDPEPLLAEFGAVRLPPLTRRDLRKPRVAAQPKKDAPGAVPRSGRKAADGHRARSVLPTIVPGAVPSLVPMAGGTPPEVPALKHRRRDDFTDADAGSAAALVAAGSGAARPAVNERPATFLAGAKDPAKGGPNWSIALLGALAAVGLAAAVQLWPDGPHEAARAAAGGRPAPARAAVKQPAAPIASPAPAASPAATAAPPAAAAGMVTVRITARSAPTWLGVTNEAGKQLYWDILEPGQARQFTDARRLDVIIGDASAADLVVNGHDLGSRGSPGQELRASYNPASAG
jgi:cytoskeletal protein RodZ